MVYPENLLSLYTEVKSGDTEYLKKSTLSPYPLARVGFRLFDEITDLSTRRACMGWDKYPKSALIFIGGGDEKEYSAFVMLNIEPPKDMHLSMEGYSGPVTVIRGNLTVYDYKFSDVKDGKDFREIYAELLMADAARKAAKTISSALWHPIDDITLPISAVRMGWLNKVLTKANGLIEAALLNGEFQPVKPSVLYL